MDVTLVVVGGDAKAKEVKLKLPTIIGRGRDASLTLPHPLVSRQHCEIFESNGKLMVRDLGSLNGSFINNERITESELPAGELLTIGTVTFRAVYEVDPNSVPPVGPVAPVINTGVEETVREAGQATEDAEEVVAAVDEDVDASSEMNIEFDEFETEPAPVAEAAAADEAPAADEFDFAAFVDGDDAGNEDVDAEEVDFEDAPVALVEDDEEEEVEAAAFVDDEDEDDFDVDESLDDVEDTAAIDIPVPEPAEAAPEVAVADEEPEAVEPEAVEPAAEEQPAAEPAEEAPAAADGEVDFAALIEGADESHTIDSGDDEDLSTFLQGLG